MIVSKPIHYSFVVCSKGNFDGIKSLCISHFSFFVEFNKLIIVCLNELYYSYFKT